MPRKTGVDSDYLRLDLDKKSKSILKRICRSTGEDDRVLGRLILKAGLIAIDREGIENVLPRISFLKGTTSTKT